MFRQASTYFFLLLACWLYPSANVTAQQTIYDETTLLYKKEINGGVHLHGHGAGLFFTKSKQKTAVKHHRWNIELVTMKHPKEEKRFFPSSDNAKGYFFGKKNALIMLRPTIGRKKIISEKYRKDGVSFSTNFEIGPAIGLLKPVYIEYIVNRSGNIDDLIEIQRFDIDRHSNINNIFGRASFFEGIFETTAVIGLHTKLGIDFEYSPYQTGVKGLEAGIALDAFPKRVEIMDLQEVKNKRFFLSFYLRFYMGKKYNNLAKG
ncbi:MAG: hypothetical protein ACI8XB_000322 [Patiriisocius sp.]|jgi:hypothetical protein